MQAIVIWILIAVFLLIVVLLAIAVGTILHWQNIKKCCCGDERRAIPQPHAKTNKHGGAALKGENVELH